MINLEDSVSGHESMAIFFLEVSAGAKKTRFPAGYNEWRGTILCSVSSPPVGGKANKAVITAVAGFFSLPSRSVKILSGAASPLKRVCVEGISPDEVINRINESFR